MDRGACKKENKTGEADDGKGVQCPATGGSGNANGDGSRQKPPIQSELGEPMKTVPSIAITTDPTAWSTYGKPSKYLLRTPFGSYLLVGMAQHGNRQRR